MELRFRRCRNLPMARPDYEAGKQGDKRFLSTRMHSRTWIPRARTKSWREREREREGGESGGKRKERDEESARELEAGRERERDREQQVARTRGCQAAECGRAIQGDLCTNLLMTS